ncbi:hypothetical protein ACC668_20420 [Rhizobium ruizarguesonis]
MALITDDRSDWLIARGLGISKDAVADIARHDISSAPTDDRFGAGRRPGRIWRVSQKYGLSAIALRVSPGQNWALPPRPSLAAKHQTFKNRPLSVDTHSRAVHLKPSVTKKDDGSMEVEIAWILPLTIY